jgi:hypothetical protein
LLGKLECRPVSSCACGPPLRKSHKSRYRSSAKTTLATPGGGDNRTGPGQTRRPTCATCGKWNQHVRKKCAGRRGVSYVSCHSAEINPGIHENGKYMVGVHFQMTATSNNDICIALSLPNASELHFASTCRAPCSALSEPRHMNRKLTSSHGTHRRWEKFGSGDTMESTSSEEEISRARVSLASAYPLKCMKVDAQHFPWV